MGEATGGAQWRGQLVRRQGVALSGPDGGGGGGIDAELVLMPDHMARLEKDQEFCGAVTPDKQLRSRSSATSAGYAVVGNGKGTLIQKDVLY